MAEPESGTAAARETDPKQGGEHHARLMDRTYRFTRHVYDLSRRYFLLGRDTAIRELDLKPGQSLVEVGCGTARNLLAVHRRYPQAQLCGVEISEQMLVTARAKLKTPALKDSIRLHLGPAEKLDPKDFGLEAFDHVFFSYSLSMMPTWEQALEKSLEHLAPGGTIHVVDFWDQKKLPKAFRVGLERFLAAFHVHHRPELIEWMENRAAKGDVELELRELYGRYAYIARLRHKAS
jgi:S-adenosylmethionine-diacylgycerolhomoserine-N-methlytransferase